jgi:hypothetical protein
MRITILELNYNSKAEAMDFARYCESNGHEVDFRKNTSGVVPMEQSEQELKNELWENFCRE